MQFLTWAKEFSISISFHPINLADTSVCFDMIYKLIVHFSVICCFPVSAKYSPVLLTRLPAAFSETARSADKMSKFQISQESAKVLNSLAPSPKQKATLFSSAVTVLYLWVCTMATSVKLKHVSITTQTLDILDRSYTKCVASQKVIQYILCMWYRINELLRLHFRLSGLF